MKSINLKIKTIDTQKEFQVSRIHIFSTKYNKKIGKNEVHNPGPCRIIFETNKKIITNLLFTDSIIESDGVNNVLISTIDLWDQVTQKIFKYTKKEFNKSKDLFMIYKIKGIENLLPEEIVEYSICKEVVELFGVQNIKIPYKIGGGF